MKNQANNTTNSLIFMIHSPLNNLLCLKLATKCWQVNLLMKFKPYSV